MQKVGVIGSGDVGKVLARGLKQHGYEVQIGSRTAAKVAAFAAETGIGAGTFADVAAWGDALVLAVKGTVALDTLRSIGEPGIGNKVVIDATNPIAEAPPDNGVLRFFTGPNESLMEQLQQAFPDGRFVKAFNSVGSRLMVNPVLAAGRSSMFICGNDAQAKADVTRLCEQFGHDVWDMGTAASARAIEPLSMLWCIPGFLQNDWYHALAMLRG